MAYSIEYKKTTWGRAVTLLSNARARCKSKNVGMQLTTEWVNQRLENGTCEITGIAFNLNPTTECHTRRWDAPSLDRIDKTKPYTEENTRVVLWAVNCALAEYGTEIMLPILKAMVKGIENAKEKPTTPVSKGANIKSAKNTKPGTLPTTGTGEDSDDAHHHCGADARKDANRSAQTSGGDSVGHRDTEVGAPKALEGSQDTGNTDSTVGSVEEWFERVRSQSRKLDLATGTTGSEVQQSDNRRIESLQGSFDEAFQSLEKALEELREARNPNRNTNTSGDA